MKPKTEATFQVCNLLPLPVLAGVVAGVEEEEELLEDVEAEEEEEEVEFVEEEVGGMVA